MTTCSQCGATVKSGWKACPQCGHRIGQRTCPTCGGQMEHGWQHCPYCGETDRPSVPSLPGDAELEAARACHVSSEKMSRAERLLQELRHTVDGIARAQKYHFGDGFRALFRGMPELDEQLKAWSSLHDEFRKALEIDICDSLDSPWGRTLGRKKTPDPAEYVDILRQEIRWLEGRLAEVGGFRPDEQEGSRGESADRFTCPGCGQPATAKNASLCPNCQQYVHHDCALKGFVNWSCPVCETGLVGQS